MQAATLGKTTGDFRVSDYTDIGQNSAFEQALTAAFSAANKVVILDSYSSGTDVSPYVLYREFKLKSHMWIEGESERGVCIQMAVGKNKSVFLNEEASSVSGITY